MNRFILLMLAFVVCAVHVHAQDDELDSFDFDDVEEDYSDIAAYYAVAAGFTTSLHYGDFDGVNSLMPEMDGASEIASPMLLTGWEVVLAIGIVPDLRLGFSMQSGTSIEEGTLVISQDAEPFTVDRRFEYSMSFQGVVIDYAYKVTNEFVLLPGVGFHWGSMEINSSQSFGDRSFENEFRIGDNLQNEFRLVEASHISASFGLDVEYSIDGWAMVRVNGGYMLNLSTSDWEVDKIKSPVSNAPDIDTSGMMLQAGIFIGLFN